MPTPGSARRCSRASSSTGRGSTAGPAEKLKMRGTVVMGEVSGGNCVGGNSINAPWWSAKAPRRDPRPAAAPVARPCAARPVRERTAARVPPGGRGGTRRRGPARVGRRVPVPHRRRMQVVGGVLADLETELQIGRAKRRNQARWREIVPVGILSDEVDAGRWVQRP